MYFIGIGLILLGLISLAVLFFSVSATRAEAADRIVPVIARGPELREAAPAPVMEPVSLSNSQLPPADQPMDRPVHADTAGPADSLPSSSVPPSEPVAPAMAQASVRAVSPPAPPAAPKPMVHRRDPGQLAVFGTLFLDHARNLSLLAGRGLEDLPPRMFADFKRVGKGSLVCEGQGFFFKSGNTLHSYSTNDLEQIVFLNSGLALVPGSVQSPIAIVLTDESDRVKAFIRENAA